MFLCKLYSHDTPNERLRKLGSISKETTKLLILGPVKAEEMKAIFLAIPKQISLINFGFSLSQFLSEQRTESIPHLFSFLPKNVKKLESLFSPDLEISTEKWITFFLFISKKFKNLDLTGFSLSGKTEAEVKDIMQALDGISELYFEILPQSTSFFSFIPASIKILRFPCMEDATTLPSFASCPSSLEHLVLNLGVVHSSPVVQGTMADISPSINRLTLQFYFPQRISIQVLLPLLKAIPASVHRLELEFLEYSHFVHHNPTTILLTLFEVIPEHISDLALTSGIISLIPKEKLIELGKRLPYVLRIRSITTENQERHDDQIRALNQNIGQHARTLQGVLNEKTPLPSSIQLLIAEYIIASEAKSIEKFLKPKPFHFSKHHIEFLIGLGLVSCFSGVLACNSSFSLGVAWCTLGTASFGLAYYAHSQYRPRLIDRERAWDEAEEQDELGSGGFACKF